LNQGLIPIGMPVQNVRTEGLKYNLYGTTLEYGDIVSSSNTIEGCPGTDDKVYAVVESSSPLLWTVELHQNVDRYDRN